MRSAHSKGMTGNKRIYLSPPHMSGRELDYVRDVFESNWIAPLGPHVDAFEKEFAAYHGGGYSAAVANGTAALHLVLRILKIKPGDAVFCSSWTFCASAMPVTYLGAHPVFIDSDRLSWNMSPALLEEALKEADRNKKLPSAVIPVDLYGQSADMDAILQISGKYNIPVVEDAAEALGAKYKGVPVGTRGPVSIFSFNGNKIITTSGGGMIWAKDSTLIERARFLSQQARDPAPHYEHSEIGYNYRMSNILAAVGRAQLEVLDERVGKTRAIFDYYRKRLSAFPGVTFMPEPEWSFHTRWLTCIVVDPSYFKATREDIRIYLEKHNVESRPLWKPMHLQPVFKGYPVHGGDVSANLFRDGLCLPSGTAMTDEELDLVCGLIEKVHSGAR
jgi:dTDP-4-amino-4,6-dideoxygalactose transaminase